MTAREGVPETTDFKLEFFGGSEIENIMAWDKLAVDIER